MKPQPISAIEAAACGLLHGDRHKLNLLGRGGLEGLNGAGQGQAWDAHTGGGDSGDRSLLVVVIGWAGLVVGVKWGTSEEYNCYGMSIVGRDATMYKSHKWTAADFY